MHGCLLGYTLYGVVSSECSCRSIARRQASMGGFAPEATPSPPSPVASESKDDDDDDDGDDDDASDDADGDVSSTDKMST